MRTNPASIGGFFDVTKIVCWYEQSVNYCVMQKDTELCNAEREKSFLQNKLL